MFWFYYTITVTGMLFLFIGFPTVVSVIENNRKKLRSIPTESIYEGDCYSLRVGEKSNNIYFAVYEKPNSDPLSVITTDIRQRVWYLPWSWLRTSPYDGMRKGINKVNKLDAKDRKISQTVDDVKDTAKALQQAKGEVDQFLTGTQ